MTDRPAPAPKTSPVPILPILSINFVGTLGFSIVLPFLVFLVTKWGGNALIYGALAATYSFFQLIGAPVLGAWSDRFGRRPVLLLSQIGTLLSWVVFLIAFALPVTVLWQVDSVLLGQFTLTLPLLLLFIARAADGLTGGNVSVANAYLADITDADHRTENFGRMSMSTNIGFVAGPALAGLLGASQYGEILPVVAALLISVVASFLIAFGLTESMPRALASKPNIGNACKVFGQEHKECYRLEGRGRISTRELLRLPGMAALLAVNFLVMLGFSLFYVAFPTHAAGALSWTVTEAGIYFTVLSLLMVLVQGPLLQVLARRVPEPALIIGGGLVLAFGFALLFFNATVLVYGAAGLIALGNGLMWPTFMALLSRQAGDTYQGAVQGFASSSGAAAGICGLVAGGVFYTLVGTAVFLVSALILVAAAAIALSFRTDDGTEATVADTE